MKTILNILLCFLLLLAGTSCHDVLDKEPLGELSTENFYDYQSYYLEALTAIYNQVHQGYVNGAHRPGVRGDCQSDDVVLGTTTPNANIISHYNYTYSAENNNQGPWNGLYTIVTLSNTFLEKVSDGQDNRSEVARGEAYFLRGWAYLMLYMWYGNPIVYTTNPVVVSEYNMSRATSEEVWARILEDFNEAQQRLPLRWDATNLGRATRGAALAHLAKAYLYMEDFPKAAETAAAVISLGVYELETDYARNFTLEGENNIESVFEIQYGVNLGPFGWQGTQHNLLQMYAPRAMANKIGYSGNVQGGYLPSQDLFNAYENNDRRVKANFILPGDTISFDGQSVVAPANINMFRNQNWSATGIANRKHLAPPSSFINGNAWNSVLNWKLMRFAEVLLMHAEAACNTGELATALNSLNRVRTRAGLTALTPQDVDQATLTGLIRLEYRRELAFEGHRFFNLMRWKVYPQAMISRGFVIGKHELYPIASTELVVNPTLEQNPNW
jgi:starch-binding outer membrane protein, SusD/RagB family